MRCRCYIAAESAYARIQAETLTQTDCETGGILIGRAGIVAGELVVVVAAATGPGPQALHLPHRFEADTARLQEELEQWRTEFAAYSVDYLGEWHSHPYGVSTPSAADTRQAQYILDDPAYVLPHGLLLMIATCQNQHNTRQATIDCYFYAHAAQQPVFIQVEQFDGDIGQLLGALEP